MINKTLIIYYFVYIVFIIVFAFSFSNTQNSLVLINDLKISINQYGILSPIIYIILVCLAIVVPPLPDTPFILVGGIAFAFPIAVLSAIIAFAISATINFYIGRYFVEKILKFITTKNDRNQINSFSSYINARSVLIFRSLPGISFGLVSFAAGFSNISYKKYIIATMIPTIIYVVLVFYFIDEIVNNPAIFSLVSFASILVLIAIPFLVQIKWVTNWIKKSK